MNKYTALCIRMARRGFQLNLDRLAFIPFVLSLLLVPAQVAQSVPHSFGGIQLTQVTPRVITPNGDSLNDAVLFKFDDILTGLPFEGLIHDISGAKVGAMKLTLNDTALLWDGKDDGGKTVPSGIYIYSIKIGKNKTMGSVVVAR